MPLLHAGLCRRADRLAGNKVANLREGTSGLLVRLTCLAQELPEATVDDGWLIQ